MDYVPKPFTPNQIRLAGQRILEERRLRRRLSERQEELDERESRHEALVRELEAPSVGRQSSSCSTKSPSCGPCRRSFVP